MTAISSVLFSFCTTRNQYSTSNFDPCTHRKNITKISALTPLMVQYVTLVTAANRTKLLNSPKAATFLFTWTIISVAQRHHLLIARPAATTKTTRQWPSTQALRHSSSLTSSLRSTSLVCANRLCTRSSKRSPGKWCGVKTWCNWDSLARRWRILRADISPRKKAMR